MSKTEIPSIRFRGFDDAWEQRKFGEIASKYEDPVPTPHDGYYRLGIRSHAKGTFHSYVAKGQELETAQMHRVAAGNFIVNITFGWEHAVAITDENDAGKLVSHRFPQFSFAEGMVPEFFRYVIVDEKFRHHLWLASPGGAGRNRVLKLDDMLNYLMRFPSRDEQIKIAEFFRQLDHLITLHQRKFEKLTNVKKSMLEKMFPQNGSSYPEIRFKGFTDPWEQRKFSDVVATRRGLTYKPSDIRKNGVRVLRSSNIAEDSFVLSDEDVFVVREAVNIDCVRANDILITAANGSSRLVGKHTIISGIPEESAVHGGFMLLGTTKEPHFVNASMGSSWYRRFIELFVAGGNGAIGNLNKNDLDNQDIAIPSEKEQKKIGSFFRQLDNLITLHQRELEKLQNIKKSMLEKMFV